MYSCFILSLFFVFVSYAKAAFCLEELMMTNPHNHLYCQQYAEVGISEKSIVWLHFLVLCCRSGENGFFNFSLGDLKEFTENANIS